MTNSVNEYTSERESGRKSEGICRKVDALKDKAGVIRRWKTYLQHCEYRKWKTFAVDASSEAQKETRV